MTEEIKILDACCGSRMFWFDKNESHTTFMDIRLIKTLGPRIWLKVLKSACVF